MSPRSSSSHPGAAGPRTSPGDAEAGALAQEASLAERAARSLAEGLQGRHEEPFEIQLLASMLDYAAALEVVSAAFVPRFADWGFIHLVDEAGIARRVKVAHADPAKAELAEHFRSLAPEPGKATITGQAIRDRSPRLVREVSEHVLRWAAHDHRHYLALKALAPRSILVLPLLARGRCVGGVTLMRAEQTPGFTEADLVDAQKLIVAAALALDNAERFARASAAPPNATKQRAAAQKTKRPSRRVAAGRKTQRQTRRATSRKRSAAPARRKKA